MDIVINKLNKSFDKKQVIEDFSLTLPPKGIICFYGPSGCGKTTLLNIILGIIPKDSGTIEGLENRKIGVVFQEDRLLPWLNADENVAAAIKDGENPTKYLEMAELYGAGEEYPGEMSGGMKRRVAIARAFAYKPDIMLLDEPFTAIDDAVKAKIITTIKKMGKESLVILVTHDIDEAQNLCDEAIILSGPPLKIIKRVDTRDIRA